MSRPNMETPKYLKLDKCSLSLQNDKSAAQLQQRHSNRDSALPQYHFEFRNGSALAAGTALCRQTLRQAIGRLNLTLNFHIYIWNVWGHVGTKIIFSNS